MQSFGDLEDLEQVLGKKVLRKVRGSGHCSAFIKLLPKNADLLVSQVTWNDYNAMLRIYKLYNFGFHRQEPAGLIFEMHVTYFFDSSLQTLIDWVNSIQFYLEKVDTFGGL